MKEEINSIIKKNNTWELTTLFWRTQYNK
jgi:hypothetical protein